MMKTLLSTCFFLGLLSPAAFISCVRCRALKTSCKDGTTRVCTEEDNCFSGALSNNIVPKFEVSTYRGCSSSSYCHSGDYSFSAAQGKFLQLKLSCCQTSGCNKEPVHLPPREDLSLNGRQCPACFNTTEINKPNNKSCPTEGYVSCRANETKCIHYYSAIGYHHLKTLKWLTFKGCATEDLCALDGKKLSYGDFGLLRIETKCWNAEIPTKKIDLER